jgi:hypothetical protein
MQANNVIALLRKDTLFHCSNHMNFNKNKFEHYCGINI